MKVTSTLFYFSGGECDKTISGHLKYIAEIFIAFIYYLFMWTYVCGGQSHGNWFSLPPYGSWGWNLGCQAWLQAPAPLHHLTSPQT